MKITCCDKCLKKLDGQFLPRAWLGFTREFCDACASEFDDDVRQAERQIRAKWFPETTGVPTCISKAGE